MKARTCGMSREEKEIRRLNYCGACKAIGADYGAKARMLLDHDAVFLAELLAELAGETFESAPARLKSKNCLAVPRENVPASLRFAAATNIALAGFKLDDHVADERAARYKVTRKLLKSEVESSLNMLRDWSFPLVEIRGLLASQTAREANFESLDDVALPTAETTATFFAEGAKFVGRADAADAMRAFGFAFGKLIYLVDAFEDFEKDVRRGSFNAFRAAYETDTFDAAARRRCASVVRAAERDCAELLRELPFKTERFESRLAQNVARTLRAELPVVKLQRVCPPRPTLQQRWRDAVEKSRGIASNYGWQMPLVFVFVLVFAFAAPAQTREARSARECFDLGFNLMFLGAFAASVVAFPKTLLIGRKARRRMTEAGGGGDGGGSGWCSGCTCGDCGDCCDCGDCACDCCDGNCCCDCGDCCSCDC